MEKSETNTTCPPGLPPKDVARGAMLFRSVKPEAQPDKNCENFASEWVLKGRQ
jgi:hypothetical protein